LDVEQHQAVVSEDPLHRREREIRKVLVIDGVELILVHQLEQMRKLHRDDAARSQQTAHPGDEIVDVGNVREDVVAEQKVRLAVVRGDRDRTLDAEEPNDGRYAFGDGDLRHVRRRLNAEARYRRLDEVLEQVAIVARDLHHLRLRAELEASNHELGIYPR